jgi:hypothetical protein
VENKIQITLKVNQAFDSLYKLGYFLIDINSVLNFCNKINKQRMEEANKPKKYNLGITSRYLNKDSLEDIKIIKFQQGSLILEILCEIIVGVILIIIGKYINRGENKGKMEITINNPKIYNIVENNFDNQLPLDRNIENIVEKLKNENFLSESGLLYDKDGKKILVKNIDRIKGQILNEKW